jgi:hypothetical protein
MRSVIIEDHASCASMVSRGDGWSRSISTGPAAAGITAAHGLGAALGHVSDGLGHFAAAAVLGVGAVPGDALLDRNSLRHR